MRLIAKDLKENVIGEYVCLEDGYYSYAPDHENGVFLNETLMSYVLLQLRRLNAKWDIQVQTDPALAGYKLGTP